MFFLYKAVVLKFVLDVYFKTKVRKRDIKKLQAFPYQVSIRCSSYSFFLYVFLYCWLNPNDRKGLVSHLCVAVRVCVCMLKG